MSSPARLEPIPGLSAGAALVSAGLEICRLDFLPIRVSAGIYFCRCEPSSADEYCRWCVLSIREICRYLSPPTLPVLNSACACLSRVLHFVLHYTGPPLCRYTTLSSKLSPLHVVLKFSGVLIFAPLYCPPLSAPLCLYSTLCSTLCSTLPVLHYGGTQLFLCHVVLNFAGVLLCAQLCQCSTLCSSLPVLHFGLYFARILHCQSYRFRP